MKPLKQLYTCDFCGEIFERIPNFDYWGREYKHHFCNKKCSTSFQKNRVNFGDIALGNVHRLKEKINTPCLNCGIPVYRYVTPPTTNVFCTSECRRKYHLNNPRISRYEKRKVVKFLFACQRCGKTFETTNIRRVFCSNECYLESYSEKAREPIKKELPEICNKKIEGTTCCTILKSHHNLLKDDPEKLSTDFIKKLSQCSCKEEI
jgi:hypothetical protein